MSSVERLRRYDSSAEAKGQTILSIVDSASGVSAVFERKTRDILADNGIEDPDPNEWYPLENYLRALDTIADEVGENTVRQIGKGIPEQAEWPPDVTTAVGGLESVAVAYDMNHRGGNIGGYEVVDTDSNSATVRCENPYSCALDQGIVHGTVDKFADRGAFVRVDESGTDCRTDGGTACTYEVSW